MGDRANVYLTNDYSTTDGSKGIYFYTHWSGYVWPEILRQALKFGESRWNDDSYLVRILASRMFKQIEDDTIGGGIGVTIGDNSWPVTVVDLTANRVYWAEEGDETKMERWYGGISFEDFCAQDTATYAAKIEVAVVGELVSLVKAIER